MEITIDGNQIQLNDFTKYIERDLPIPDGSSFTTGVMILPDGTLLHVPTGRKIINGEPYAAIFSRTNSIYTLINKQVSFSDMPSHWANGTVNDMASRLIISGVGDNDFAPDRDITRAEFAAIVIRALGLKAHGSSSFSDVNAVDWYYGVVTAAQEYGIISGYQDNTFKPNAQITREEAMVMIARAMDIAGMDTAITDETVEAQLQSFSDSGSFSSWAKPYGAVVIRSGLVKGSDGCVRPGHNISRAETATIVQNLLAAAGLID